MNEETIKQIITSVIAAIDENETKRNDTVPVEVSARHVHLSQSDVERLFGKGHRLTKKRELSQPGQFLAEERVSLVTAKGEYRNVAVLGPTRSATQVELSITDAKGLGIAAPIRQSGDLRASGDICILSKEAVMEAKEAVITAQNHIHMAPKDAMAYGVCDGQRVKVKMNTTRPVQFDDVVIRVRDDFQLAMHIDFDEANACAFEKNDSATILSGTGIRKQPLKRENTGPCAATRPEAELEQAVSFISAETAKALIRSGKKALKVTKKTLITPLAKDLLREKRIDLLYEEDI